MADSITASEKEIADLKKLLNQIQEVTDKRYLLKNPVVNTNALKAITSPEVGETRQVLSYTDKVVKYTFIETITTGLSADDDTIGSWVTADLGEYNDELISEDDNNQLELGQDGRLMVRVRDITSDTIVNDVRAISYPASGRIRFYTPSSTNKITFVFPDTGTNNSGNKFTGGWFSMKINILNYITQASMRTGSIDLLLTGGLSNTGTFYVPKVTSLIPTDLMLDDIKVVFGKITSSGLPCITIEVIQSNSTTDVVFKQPGGGVYDLNIYGAEHDHPAWDTGWEILYTDGSEVTALITHPVIEATVAYSVESAANAARAGLGTININPTFVLGDVDYKNFIKANPTQASIDYTKTDKTAGSLKVVGQYRSLIGDNFIAADATKQYRAVCSVSATIDGPSFVPDAVYKHKYFQGTVSYDSDKSIISPWHVTKRRWTDTTLAAPLSNGDTSITIVDGSRWYNATVAHRRSITLHKKQPDGRSIYTGINGREYDDLGYSRYLAPHSYNANSITDNGDGTWKIALRNPWSLGSFAIGDAIRNSFSAGSFSYWISSRDITYNSGIDRHKSTWRKQDLRDTSKHKHNDIFRNGTAFVKLLILPNYGVYKNNAYIGHNPSGLNRTTWIYNASLEFREGDIPYEVVLEGLTPPSPRLSHFLSRRLGSTAKLISWSLTVKNSSGEWVSPNSGIAGNNYTARFLESFRIRWLSMDTGMRGREYKLTTIWKLD